MRMLLAASCYRHRNVHCTLAAWPMTTSNLFSLLRVKMSYSSYQIVWILHLWTLFAGYPWDDCWTLFQNSVYRTSRVRLHLPDPGKMICLHLSHSPQTEGNSISTSSHNLMMSPGISEGQTLAVKQMCHSWEYVSKARTAVWSLTGQSSHDMQRLMESTLG